MQRGPFAILACVSFYGLGAHASSQPITVPPYEVLRSFDRPPVRPLAGLAEWQGALYGAAAGGGHYSRGALFRRALPSANPNAAVEKVHSWSEADFQAGHGPALGTPLAASDGNLYGVAGQGGSSTTSGWIYRISPAGETTELYPLDYSRDGAPSQYFGYAPGPLVESGEFLYGTLYGGGEYGKGTLFRVSKEDGAFDCLHSFGGGDGEFPMAGLVERDGWLYGTTAWGGRENGGTLFRIAPSGSGFETLHDFTRSEGGSPAAELVVGPDRLLYGAARGGGPATPYGCGTVFRVDPDANPVRLDTLASFACNGDLGTNPEGGMVVLDVGGTQTLFGLTPGSSQMTVRTIYRISLGPAPKFDVLATLPADALCWSRLLHASDGQIYGQCFSETDSSEGRVFRIDPATGNVSTAFRFGVDEAGGHTPYALVQGPGGAIYGTTRGGGPAGRGTLFRFSVGGDFEIVHAFTDYGRREDIADPSSGNPPQYAATFLTHATDGLIYGTRCDGGANGTGSIFRLDPAAGSCETLYSASPTYYYDQVACPHGPLVESSLAPGTFFGTAMGDKIFLGAAFRFDSATNEVSPLWTSSDYPMRLFTEPVGRVALGPDDQVYAAFTTTGMWESSHFNGGVVEALRGGGIVATGSLAPNVSAPIVGLVHGPSSPDGGFVLYGSSTRGGSAYQGTLYKVSVPASGGPFALDLLHSFDGTDGAYPTAELIPGPAGVYYGSAARGGAYGYGTLFALTATNQVSTLLSFDEASGAYPETQLVAGPDGNLYGTTSSGGPGGGGVIFRLNLAPRVALEGPVTAGEGETLTFTARGGDAQRDALTFAWDLDKDGVFDDAEGETVSVTAPDGDAELLVSVQATDPTGLVARDSLTVSIANVAPTARLAVAPTRVKPGEHVVLSFADPTDPSAADRAAGFLYAYDCAGDGSYVLPSSASSHECTYPRAGTYAPRAHIQDKDGGYTEYTGRVEVLIPRDEIDLLLDEVNELVAAGDLSEDAAKHLLQELEEALKHVDQSPPGPAINQLRHFVRTVEDFVRSGELDAAAGQQLIDAANRIIATLGG